VNRRAGIVLAFSSALFSALLPAIIKALTEFSMANWLATNQQFRWPVRKTHKSLCHLREASAISAGSALASISELMLLLMLMLLLLLPNSSIANHSTAGSWPYK